MYESNFHIKRQSYGFQDITHSIQLLDFFTTWHALNSYIEPAYRAAVCLHTITYLVSYGSKCVRLGVKWILCLCEVEIGSVHSFKSIPYLNVDLLSASSNSAISITCNMPWSHMIFITLLTRLPSLEDEELVLCLTSMLVSMQVCSLRLR